MATVLDQMRLIVLNISSSIQKENMLFFQMVVTITCTSGINKKYRGINKA